MFDVTTAWVQNVAALKKYGEKHGDCNVPAKAAFECVLEGMGEDGGDVPYSGNLGTWLKTQRCKKKGTNKPALTPEQEAVLQELVDQGTILDTLRVKTFTAVLFRHVAVGRC